MTQIKRAVATLVLVLGFCSTSFADTVLTVTVNLAGKPERSIEFSMEGLAALGVVSLRTGNDYVDGMPLFEGPLMRGLMAAVGASSAIRAQLTAVNDYTVEVPVEEFDKYDVILALKQDGQVLSRRDKGPIWMIYPISQHVELQEPTFNSRLIWQLHQVAFE